jgi:putative transcriptional regulator
MDSLKGRLLISNGGLFDPNFRHTVVLIVDHSDDGALGLVLNRPALVTVGEAIPDLADLVGSADHVYVGGPVQPEAAVVLAEYGEGRRAEDAVIASVAVVGEISPDHLEGIRRARVFGGYSGWAPGQLEGEISSNDWIVESATPDDVFTESPEALWQQVLARKGGEFEMLSRMPFDPTTN